MSDGFKSFLVASLAAIALNIVSGFLGQSPYALPVLVVIVIAAFGLTFIPLKKKVNEQGVEIDSSRQAYVHEAQYFLVFFLVGGLAGGLSVLPIFPLTQVDSGLDSLGIQANGFFTYEVVAIGVVSVLAAIGLVLGQPLLRALTFVVGGVGGATVSLTLLRPGEIDPLPTFAGWALVGVALVGVVALAPRAGEILIDYFTPRRRPTPPPAHE